MATSKRNKRKKSIANRRERRIEQLEDRRLMAVDPGASVFDADVFADNIESYVAGNAVGYAYVINQDGKVNVASGANGDARTETDGQLEFEIDTRIELASVSKTITAVAFLSALQEEGISTLTNMWAYLPTAWKNNLGPNVADITFADLLKHESGFIGGGGQNAYDLLGQMIAAGVDAEDVDEDGDASDYGNFFYKNANYALMRVLIGYVRSDVPNDTLEGEGIDAAAATAEAYKSYVQQNVLEPLGIVSADMAPTESNPALTYNFPDNDDPGHLWEDFSLNGGAFGWKLSAEDLARFINGYDTLLNPNMLKLMKDEHLGFMDPANYDMGSGEFGEYFGHGGDFFNPAGEVHTAIVEFENDVQASLVINSERGFSGYQKKILETAYENAWTDISYSGSEGDDVFEIRTSSPDGIETLEIWMGSNPSSLNKVYSHWVDTLYSLTINGYGGNDTFIVDEVPDSVSLILNGDDGNDILHAANGWGDIEYVGGITFNGGGGIDDAFIDDSNNDYSIPGSDLYTVADVEVSRDGESVFMTDVENLTLTTGDQSDWVNVFSTGRSITLKTGKGNDVIQGTPLVEGGTHPADIAWIDGLLVDGGEGIDMLMLDDRDNSYTSAQSGEYTVTKFAVQRGAPGGPLVVAMDSVESLGLLTGTGDDVVQIDSIPSATTIQLGQGEDTVNVSSTADRTSLELFGNEGTDIFNVAPIDRDLDSIQGDIRIHGGDGFGTAASQDEYFDSIDDDQIYVHDEFNTSPDSGNFTIEVLDPTPSLAATGRITREATSLPGKIGGKPTDFKLTYDQVERTYLSTDDDANHIVVLGAPKLNQLTVNAGGGDDEIEVHATAQEREMYMLGEAGADTIRVTPVGRNLEKLFQTLWVDGGSNTNDQLEVNDYEFTGAAPYSLDTLSLWRFNSAGDAERRIRYAGFDRMNVFLNDAANQIDVYSTAPGTTTALHGYQGNDELTVWSASSVIEFFAGSEVSGLENDRAVWIGTQTDDQFTVVGDTIQNGDGTLTTHGVEIRSIEGQGGIDLLRIAGRENVDELFHIRPDLLQPYEGTIDITGSQSLRYEVEDMEVVGNESNLDRLRMDGTGGEEDYFKINLGAHGTHNSPLISVGAAEGEFLRLRSASGLTSGGSVNTPAIGIHALAQLGEFDVIAPELAPADNPTAINVFGTGGWDAVEVNYQTGGIVTQSFHSNSIVGTISVEYADRSYTITGTRLEEVSEVQTAPGDFDGNGVVDDEDLGVWAANFNQTVEPYSSGDANGDGKVDINDWTMWKDHEGTSVEPVAAPFAALHEPAPAGEVVMAIAPQPEYISFDSAISSWGAQEQHSREESLQSRAHSPGKAADRLQRQMPDQQPQASFAKRRHARMQPVASEVSAERSHAFDSLFAEMGKESSLRGIHFWRAANFG